GAGVIPRVGLPVPSLVHDLPVFVALLLNHVAFEGLALVVGQRLVWIDGAPVLTLPGFGIAVLGRYLVIPDRVTAGRLTARLAGVVMPLHFQMVPLLQFGPRLIEELPFGVCLQRLELVLLPLGAAALEVLRPHDRLAAAAHPGLHRVRPPL